MDAWAPYRPGALQAGDVVVTGVDEPWSPHASAVRTERVLWVNRLLVRTDHQWYWRGGRQTRVQPLPHPRRILSRRLAD